MTKPTPPDALNFFADRGEKPREMSRDEKLEEDGATLLSMLGHSVLLHDATIREALQAYLREARRFIAAQW